MVDMRLKFNLEFREYNTETPVVLLNLDSMLVGFIVDSVFNVNNFSVSQLQFLPKFYYINNKQFFKSAFITNDQIACMLNVDNILTLSEADYLKRVSQEAARKIQSSGKE
jgi:purine-binding chemotaxis protein CheW